MENRKYEFTGETMEWEWRILHRIRAIRGFSDVNKGELGGWIEDERNLSHEGNCWVFDESKVCDNAAFYGNARVRDNAIVCGEAIVYGNAVVRGEAIICDNAEVHGNADVFEDARVSGNARVCSNAIVRGEAIVHDNAVVRGEAIICSNAVVRGEAIVCGNARVYDNAIVVNAIVCGEARVFGNARISSKDDIFLVGPIGSRNDYTTFYKGSDEKIMVVCGCFLGDIDKFEKTVEKTHNGNKYEKEYKTAIEMAKIHITV